MSWRMYLPGVVVIYGLFIGVALTNGAGRGRKVAVNSGHQDEHIGSYLGKAGCDGSGPCHRLRVRRNVKSLTREELQEVIDVFVQLKEKGVIRDMTALHVTRGFKEIHGQAQFFPWHRMFLIQFETEMRKIKPNITLPYWDASIDCSNPWKSPVFTPQYFGGNGNPKHEYCVEEGFVKNWTFAHPHNSCLRRQFGGTSVTWQCPEWVTSVLQTTQTYDEFNAKIATSLHYSVHRLIGGDAGDLTRSWSPHDPLLYLHHANLDRIWAKWQLSDPRKACDYNGLGLHSKTRKTFEAKIRDKLTFYKTTPIEKVMKLGFGTICYTYDEIMPQNWPKSKSIAQKRLEDTISHEDLVKFFPKLVDKSASVFDVDLPHVSNPSSDEKHPLPYSQPIGRSALGHSFAVTEAAEVRFVSALRKNGYVSPYNDPRNALTAVFF